MDLFLARQPIFDLQKDVQAYEIFYRSGYTNHYTGTDGDAASSKVIVDTFQNIGLQNLTAGKPAFINFSARLIAEQVATLFPIDSLAIEVFEKVVMTNEILDNCALLKEAGYKIVLDDFVYSKELEPLLKLADIVKIDFRAISYAEIETAIKPLKDWDVVLLAEKVETWEDFNLAKDLGFDLFQGYFFSHPEVITGKRLSPLELNSLELMVELNKLEFDYAKIANIISRDISLSYSLLKLVNSALFAKRSTIYSIQQALAYLGIDEIKRWVNLIAMQKITINKPIEAVTTSLVRARFLELVAEKTKWRSDKDALFLAGLFSMLDVLLQRPLEVILNEVKAPAEIKALLIDEKGTYEVLWKILIAYERGNWEDCIDLAKDLNLTSHHLSRAYIDAILWVPA